MLANLGMATTWLLACLVYLIVLGGFLSVPTYGFLSTAIVPILGTMLIPTVRPHAENATWPRFAIPRVHPSLGPLYARSRSGPLPLRCTAARGRACRVAVAKAFRDPLMFAMQIYPAFLKSAIRLHAETKHVLMSAEEELSTDHRPEAAEGQVQAHNVHRMATVNLGRSVAGGKKHDDHDDNQEDEVQMDMEADL